MLLLISLDPIHNYQGKIIKTCKDRSLTVDLLHFCDIFDNYIYFLPRVQLHCDSGRKLEGQFTHCKFITFFVIFSLICLGFFSCVCPFVNLSFRLCFYLEMGVFQDRDMLNVIYIFYNHTYNLIKRRKYLTHWVLSDEYPRSTVSVIFHFFASFGIGQISHQQHKGYFPLSLLCFSI